MFNNLTKIICTQKRGYKYRYISHSAYRKVFIKNTGKNVFRIVCIIIFNKQKITLTYQQKTLIFQGYLTNFIRLNADCQCSINLLSLANLAFTTIVSNFV